MDTETIFMFISLFITPFAGWGMADMYRVLTHTHSKVN